MPAQVHMCMYFDSSYTVVFLHSVVVYADTLQVVDVPAGGELMKMARTVTLGEHEFEGTPSRDSLRYISIYGIEGVKTLLRGLFKHKVL